MGCKNEFNSNSIVFLNFYSVHQILTNFRQNIARRYILQTGKLYYKFNSFFSIYAINLQYINSKRRLGIMRSHVVIRHQSSTVLSEKCLTNQEETGKKSN